MVFCHSYTIKLKIATMLVVALMSILSTTSLCLASTNPLQHTKTQKWQVNHSKIINTKNNKAINPTEFIDTLSSYPYLIVGEYHDRKNQHKAVLWLLTELQQRRPQGSLLLEMLTTDQQPLIDEVAASGDMNELPKRLNWQNSWDWALYGDIIRHALTHHYPLIATNLNKSEVHALLHNQKPTTDESDNDSTLTKQLKRSIQTHHNITTLDDKDNRLLDNMVGIQQARDRQMATFLITSKTPALLLTGNYHAQKQLGIPLYINRINPNQAAMAKTAVIMMIDNDIIDKKTRQNADFLWIIAD